MGRDSVLTGGTAASAVATEEADPPSLPPPPPPTPRVEPRSDTRPQPAPDSRIDQPPTVIDRPVTGQSIDNGPALIDQAPEIGTALETRAGVFIHGEQHFAEVLRDFACYGHPIVDPLTRRLVGAVDLTGMSADASRMFAPFVRKIVADIEARYVDTARADDRELWHRFVERTRSSDTATCAFGDEVVDYFVTLARSSWDRFAAHVTDWEQREYFEMF